MGGKAPLPKAVKKDKEKTLIAATIESNEVTT
jgi:hypothetical protein